MVEVDSRPDNGRPGRLVATNLFTVAYMPVNVLYCSCKRHMYLACKIDWRVAVAA